MTLTLTVRLACEACLSAWVTEVRLALRHEDQWRLLVDDPVVSAWRAAHRLPVASCP